MSRTTPIDAGQAGDREVVRLASVGVRFGDNTVLRDVTTAFAAGTITALLGTNGAGKSTLIGAVSGALPHYTGDLEIDGDVRRISTVSLARQAGIETVHQRIADGIVPGLSVAENVLLTDLSSDGHRLIDRRTIETQAAESLRVLGLTWSPSTLRADAARLATSDAQLVILARALRSRPRLLILDEPTSALTAAEADRLFAVLRSLRDGGTAIVIVSHRFGEIERLADRIVVLRDGTIALEAVRPFDWHAAIEAMLGVPAELQQHIDEPLPAGAAAVTVAGATLTPASPPLTLTVHAGQVTGILGLLGAGKTELAELLTGARTDAAAHLTLDGEPYAPRSTAAAIARGAVLVPEDRQRDAIQPGWSLARTAGLPVLASLANRLGIVRTRDERRVGADVVEHYGVIAPSLDAELDELSGGNQQKVIVGRWLRTEPRLAVLDEPFRGVDIAARRVIGAAARDRARAGGAVLVVSSDVDEILEVADRIIVLVQGRITLDCAAGSRDRGEIVAALLEDHHHPEQEIA